MTVFLLIRHGSTDMLGQTIAGRMPGVHLNPEGVNQAQRLSERLADAPIERIYCSPIERTLETAAPLASRLRLEIEVKEAFTEVDFGDWTGGAIQELGTIPKWRQFNLFRSGSRIPGGEMLVEVQSRMVAEMEKLRELLPDSTVAIVSHGDVIKSALAHYAGIPLDLFLRIEISPASVSIISVDDHGPRILCVNDTGELPKF